MREMGATTMANDTSIARKAMIDSQLRTSGVNEEFVLARMAAIAREDYLPADMAPLAYIDRSVALPDGGALASPLFYGKLLLEAAPKRDDSVLIIEGGTAYLADLVRPLVASVATTSAAEAASGAATGNGSYSLVLIDGAIEQMPESIAEMLEENGRIAGGVMLRKVTRLASGRKVAGSVSLLPVEDLGIPILSAFAAPQKWSFS